jgi:photosystem II stability/assembly factor-like uncharacterized protein
MSLRRQFVTNLTSVSFWLLRHMLMLTLFFYIYSQACAQKINILQSDRAVSLRGLSVVDDRVVWVSGSKGTVGRSVDGGLHWEWITVPGYDARDFRDIEAFDESTAVIMAIAQPAHILRTEDGGKSWKLVYENKTKGMFLDAMDFSDDRRGIVVGDVVNGHLFVARTEDGGRTWRDEPQNNYLKGDSTEGCFASSGTNVRLGANGDYYFVTGGRKSRIISNKSSDVLPFDSSRASTGANSLAVAKDSRLMIAVGGDFAADTIRNKTCFVSKDAGRTWTASLKPPYGYRSCVEFISSGKAMACGLNGVDVSADGGATWISISGESFHACRKARKGTAVFLSGNNGRIGMVVEN